MNLQESSGLATILMVISELACHLQETDLTLTTSLGAGRGNQKPIPLLTRDR